MPEASLEAAYRAAEYAVQAPTPFVLRVDEASAAARALLAQHGVAVAAFLTAANPRSGTLSDAENAVRNAALQQQLRDDGYTVLAGEGRAPDGSWREPSLLVLGLEEAAARTLALAHDQHAWLMIDATGAVTLHWSAPAA